jgi:hypothetical protein
MSLTLQPVRVGNDFEEEGMLVFDGDHRLVAVLSRLSEANEVAGSGIWVPSQGQTMTSFSRTAFTCARTATFVWSWSPRIKRPRS